MGIVGFRNQSQAGRTLFTFALVAVVSLLPQSLLAQVEGALPNLFSATLMVGGLSPHSLAKKFSFSSEVQEISPVLVRGRIRGVGNVTVQFNRQRSHPIFKRRGSAPPPPILLQGRIETNAGIFAVAGSVKGDKVRFSFVSTRMRANGNRMRAYQVTFGVPNAGTVRARISSVPLSILPRTCLPIPPSGIKRREGTEVAPTGHKQVRIVTIATDTDHEWAARFGDESNNRIAQYLNSAEVLFDSQFDIRFRLVAQHTYQSGSPYSSNDVGGILAQFVVNRDNALNFGTTPEEYRSKIQLSHLFSGKDLDGSAVGMAYIGVLCSAPALSYGVTQYFGEGVTPIILAHELGHNFGAFHDETDRGGIMYPSISTKMPNYFSTQSEIEISTHLANNAGCLSSSVLPELPRLPTATPAPTSSEPEIPSVSAAPHDEPPPSVTPENGGYSSISLSKRVRSFSGRRVIVLSGQIAGVEAEQLHDVPVELIVQREVVARSKTREDGTFSFYTLFGRPIRRTFTVWVRNRENGVVSNRVAIRQQTVDRVFRFPESIAPKLDGPVVTLR